MVKINHYKIVRDIQGFKKVRLAAYQFDYKGLELLTYRGSLGWDVIEKWTSLKVEPKNMWLMTRQIAVEEAKKLIDRQESNLPAVLKEIENKRIVYINMNFSEEPL